MFPPISAWITFWCCFVAPERPRNMSIVSWLMILPGGAVLVIRRYSPLRPLCRAAAGIDYESGGFMSIINSSQGKSTAIDGGFGALADSAHPRATLRLRVSPVACADTLLPLDEIKECGPLHHRSDGLYAG